MRKTALLEFCFFIFLESKGGGPSPLIGSRAGPMVKVYENKQHEKRPKLEVIDEIP